MRSGIIVLSLLLLAALVSAKEADFTVMSFNMERGDLGTPHGRGWDVRKEGVLAMLKKHAPGLLGVQECNSIQRDDILSELPYRYIGVAVNGVPDEYPTTSSNLIFYNPAEFELFEDGSFWYGFDPDSAGVNTWIARKPRNATWGRFRHMATGRELLYINNHLQNGVDAVLNRAMSLMELLAKVRELNPDGLPLIYTGDLNSKSIEGYYAPLRQEMLHAADACPVTDKDITHGGYRRKTGTDGQIDHIWFSGALEGLRFVVDREAYAGVEYLSDHFPVFCNLAFTDAAPSRGPLWFDLKPAEGDVTVKAGTWNLFSSVERGERHATPWADVREDIAAQIAALGMDVMGLQEMTEPMARDMAKLLKKTCGKDYKFWSAFSDPNPENADREAVGLFYNAARFSVSSQRQSWIRAGEWESPGKPWGDDYRSILSAVFKEKASGKRFFVMTGKFCKGENPVKYEGRVIKDIEKALNPEELPCILLADMNTAPRGNVWLSLLNYWTDTYALMYPFPDRQFSTRVPASGGFYEGNTPKDWGTKYDIVAVTRYVENLIVVRSHEVHRECAAFSDHCPVTAEIVFK